MINWLKVTINGDIDIAQFSKQMGISLGFIKTLKNKWIN
jgi:hypothetical protein